MRLLKLNDTGADVVRLQQLLRQRGADIDADGVFGASTHRAVEDFQRKVNIIVDGVVGAKTWLQLQGSKDIEITDLDFERGAETLGVDVAALKAVQEVESGAYGGFYDADHPTILFEGHIFWRELEKRGISPEPYAAGCGDILYPRWTKSHYIGGVKEYDRLSKALDINREAALCSASWGAFQIMGFNYKICGCETIDEFHQKMCHSEGSQLDLFVAFLKSNRLDIPLKSLDWGEFARRYNGAEYAKNRYDQRLSEAYQRYRG